MGNHRAIRFVFVCGLSLAASGALPGCKAVRKWFAPADDVGLAESPAVTGTSPLERQGLGVQMLVVDDTDYDAPRALRGYPALRDTAIQSRWSSWGFRIIEVPVGDVEMVLASLRAVQPVSVQFMGEFGNWRPIVRAGTIQQSSVQVGSSTRTVESGRPRLIARAWAEPVLSEDAVEQVLRVDLGMQIEAQGQNAYQLLPTQRESTLDDAGRVIDELLSTVRLSGQTALIIIGEAPGEDWSRLPEPESSLAEIEQDGEPAGPDAADEDSLGSDQQEPQPYRAQASSRAIIEPSAPRVRSLGELMLVAPGSRLVRANEARRIPKRVVIVLTPELRDAGEAPRRQPAQGDQS